MKLRHPPRKLFACFAGKDHRGNVLTKTYVPVEWEMTTEQGDVEYFLLGENGAKPINVRSYSNYLGVVYARKQSHTVCCDEDNEDEPQYLFSNEDEA